MFPTRTGPFKWSDLLRPFKSTQEEHVKEEDESTEVMPMFADRFTTILQCDYDENSIEMLDWINRNSISGVEVKIYPPERMYFAQTAKIKKRIIYIGFENTDDALFFKIKYSL